VRTAGWNAQPRCYLRPQHAGGREFRAFDFPDMILNGETLYRITDDEAALAAIKAANTAEVYVLPAEERKRWTEALRLVHQRFASVVGGNIIEAMYAARSAPR